MSPELSFSWADDDASRAAMPERQQARADRPHVAPAALLFITAPGGAPTPSLTLSPADTALIAGATALVLVVTIGITVMVGSRLIRPLHALTDAARNPERNTPVPVTTSDEIARLTTGASTDVCDSRLNASTDGNGTGTAGDIA